MIEGIGAITLATHDMARAASFYRMIGFDLTYGGDDAAFTSFRTGTGHLNLIAQPPERRWSWWGRPSALSRRSSIRCSSGDDDWTSIR